MQQRSRRPGSPEGSGVTANLRSIPVSGERCPYFVGMTLRIAPSWAKSFLQGHPSDQADLGSTVNGAGRRRVKPRPGCYVKPCLLVAVGICVLLACFGSVFLGMRSVTLRGVSVMRRCLVIACLMMLCSFLMVLRGMLVMFCGLGVMFLSGGVLRLRIRHDDSVGDKVKV